ncbi:hypothetical protein [Alcaligenes faecalis]|uniref:ADF-H domain-containing protein n=1 Tax=Alcaligenes faecalis TaxID=511 RepID=A0ABY7N7F7_ALCFA|nr:hypothetical protein [Alcaligenes faecalis]WBM40027.1 hypothetical protein M2J83_09515 [Alcaligenes faecalis]
MIKVYTNNPQDHLDAIIAAAKSSGATSQTWAYRDHTVTFTRDGEKREEIFPAIYHKTSDKQWVKKGEFLCVASDDNDSEDDHVSFVFRWTPNGPKESSAAENLHGRLISNLMTYFRKQPDFKSIEITIPDWLAKLD